MVLTNFFSLKFVDTLANDGEPAESNSNDSTSRTSVMTDKLKILLTGRGNPITTETIHTVDWTVLLLPAYEIVNALPCVLEVEINQPSTPTKVFDQNARGRYDGARDLFFLPDQFYVRDSSGEPSSSKLIDEDNGDWEPFITGLF